MFVDSWTTTGSMNCGRRYHTASVLANGKVLVTGDNNNADCAKSAELYDPSTGIYVLAVLFRWKREMIRKVAGHCQLIT